MTARDIFISIVINGRKGGKCMVEPVEARGHRSICMLLDLQDWDAACRRLKELGVRITHHGNRPVVSVEEVRKASLRWFQKRKKRETPR